ncbi:MAG: glycerophosphodiester phosphodiesterase [Anaerolineae bacterium]|jgi:glycerophosphoryl diester phosphodiesterase|nr:glycerophosphodiester phosphodiesterase [Anaerolineae bacterium]
MKRTVTNRPLVFAHRGAKRAAPENTLPAFEAAIRLGADGVELDVQYSSDGKLVIFHDLSLEKTSNGAGRVSAHTFEELRALDAGSHFGSEFAGTTIPTLDEALETARGKLLVNIELKTIEVKQSGLGPDVVGVVRRHGMMEDVVISSFNPFALRKSKQAGPEIEHALLLAADLPGWTRWGLIFRHSGADGLHPELGMATREYVAAAKRRNLPVRVWTVDDEAEMRRLAEIGVDAIITDIPDVALAALAQ